MSLKQCQIYIGFSSNFIMHFTGLVRRVYYYYKYKITFIFIFALADVLLGLFIIVVVTKTAVTATSHRLQYHKYLL